MDNNFIFRLKELGKILEGDLKCDTLYRTIYSTDASDYKVTPAAVIYPKGEEDIKKVFRFACENHTGVTMRAAGTSLAGQVVSTGIIIDISRYMNRILEVNTAERWVKVEPGVVLDELNIYLKQYGLFFGPETATSNRCNLGGMVGNNSCGSHSVIYGSTREHLIGLRTILSDGSIAEFGPVDKDEFEDKCRLNNLEGSIYRNIKKIFVDPENRRRIIEDYPDPLIPRRNTGYALDMLMDSELYNEKSVKKFNLCKLLAGSEGTLAAVSMIKLNCVPLPPVNKALVCIHHKERNEAFKANLIALRHGPAAVEMTDNRILELTKDNLSQRKNRFFLVGDPGAITIVEFAKESKEELDAAISDLINELKQAGYGYAYPVVTGSNISKVWALRKAGLGVLRNMKGDAKPVSLIEDAAVRVDQLAGYVDDLEKLLAKYGKDSVFHAHIGTGELHVRPVLNLKDPGDSELFRTIGLETAHLVRKYRGSLSGEHGDGRLRSEFISIILGEHIFSLLKEVKSTWDPDGILNPGKITGTLPMNSCLRYQPGMLMPEIETLFDFSSTGGIVRAAEKCNGSGDCRKSALIGGVMCPSYMASGDEKDTTRARANILQEFLGKKNGDPWDHPEIYQVLDLCISCKGCKSECPSGVDMAKLKAEFLQHWHDKHGIPLRTRLIANISTINRIGSFVPSVFNFFVSNRLTSGIIKKSIGFAGQRSIPVLYRITLKKWLERNLDSLNPINPIGTVCLFVDEFTDYNDTRTGITAVKLLTALGYRVITARHLQSARTYLSKGLIRKAKKIINGNIRSLSVIINNKIPLIGIEPSAILGFRDEYPDLADADLKKQARGLASCSFMIDEFIAGEFREGRISRDIFTKKKAEVMLHGHCQQKAVSSSGFSIEMLSIPENYEVREIPSGCCGMAGSFGYEKEHFELSNKIGELVLFRAVRNSGDSAVIAAPGTSCRHHIKDGTGRTAVHPVEVLYEALDARLKNRGHR